MNPSPPQPRLPPCVISEEEATYFWSKNPTGPLKTIARSNSATRPWVPGTEHSLNTIGRHPSLASFFADDGSESQPPGGGGGGFREIVKVLDRFGVEWTNLDPLRVVENPSSSGSEDGTAAVAEGRAGDGLSEKVQWRAILVGIKPGTLTREKGAEVVKECKEVMERCGVYDVECLIHEIRLWGSGAT
ncbi:hypothetical protein EST38_g13312 [Candolleomyces aberdarensis]|uniref:Uncharacterized protein n=1 Tax=Candolleomyces aberdarensis TaxID=2316362 RepID=A0A4Q2D1B8_9AGAR|nr:hypothetical protein EST38_g13312 [Candolleomyces aberdarensis]